MSPHETRRIGRGTEWQRLLSFVEDTADAPRLGIVWGRRRVGKSFLLHALSTEVGGLYHEAVRGSSAEALRGLGERVADHQGSAAPLAFRDWDHAIRALLALGEDENALVVLDEYPYLREHTPELDSIVQRALGARTRSGRPNRTRLVLCGSAISVMSRILGGTAPLRGRASLDLPISPFDYRTARELHGHRDHATAIRTYAVLGGILAYAREMVGDDLPAQARDFDPWLCRRVLSPGSPLFNEVELLLSEDPTTAQARKLNLYHAALAGVATGHHAHGKISSYVKIRGASLAPILDALTSAELVDRIEDPLRDHRPTYHPGDSLLRFHYALIRKHRSRLARPDADRRDLWRHLRPTFESQVLGPCFEGMARTFARHFADPGTLGGEPDHVGPTTVALGDGREVQLDVVVAADAPGAAAARPVRSIGEARVGTRLSTTHLRRLESARTALGPRAIGAKLLLFGASFSPRLRTDAASRADLELIDLERLYEGS